MSSDLGTYERNEKLPVHGFVLAGGKSSRMGEDKALLRFRGLPLVEIAVEKLRTFCVEVSIAGNRDDLREFGTVVHEERLDCGPAAGVEAGLRASKQEWALFMPVDVPLVPEELLRRWCEETLRGDRRVSYLFDVQPQPAFCLLQRTRATSFSRVLNEGEQRLRVILEKTAVADDCICCPSEMHAFEVRNGLPVTKEMRKAWFANLNTPLELEQAEAWAASNGKRYE
jgi:molybdopterin-guanine dinucleotide biosynthesis protein A